MQGSIHALIDELSEQGNFHRDKEDYQKSREIFQRLLELQTKELGEDDISVAVTLKYIGNLLEKEGNYSEALETMKRSLAIQSKKLGDTHDSANTYKDMGRLCLQLENFEEAEEMYRKALDIMGDMQPKSSDFVEASQPLVISLQMQGKLSEAIKVQKLLLSKVLEMHGEDHSEVPLIYMGIAKLLENKNRMDDAIQMLDKSIEICYRLRELGDFDRPLVLAGALDNKVALLSQQGKFEGSAEVLKKSIVIIKEELGEMHPTLAEKYETLSQVYLHQDMLEDGFNAITKALEIRRKALGNDHPDTKEFVAQLEVIKRGKNAKALNQQGVKMNLQGNSETAMQLFQEALGAHKEIFGDAHLYTAEVYENISAVKVEQGLLQDGIAASAQALKIRRKQLGDDHPDTKVRMEAHRSLLKRLLENRK
ncbi:unnamed protein product [Cylindrotheca closterium]|uniref:Kinesin light chain n=1 Tax=Cylindrotheca closterium TaxID=2856 RepID=A0AAD2FNQ7_9STRA|nr:unnamed protein product [Cylindrotheca closterium]